MAPIGSLLWRSLRVYQVYGANTEVGKTAITTTLCRAARNAYKSETTAYLKPVSTGPHDEADGRHIKRYTDGVSPSTLYQYDLAISPHAAALGKVIPSDKDLLASIYSRASQTAKDGPGWLFIETAGGVHSPGPSGTSQAELYKPLRCPVILIGDPKLGGISLTISSYESLTLRGYDVEAILLFKDDIYQNYDYLTKYFKDNHNIPVYSIDPPPPRASSPESDKKAMLEYYRQTSRNPLIHSILGHLDTQHRARVNRLESMASSAHSKIWYPFTQQKHLQPSSITTIDSAHDDHFQTLAPSSSFSTASDPTQPLLWPTFDASASWWTQGLGHASTALTLAAAHAAGRYGHVMFADCAHAPALALAEALLAGARSPRLTRVFYSDDGSTGAEVAVKMALRAARVRYGGGGGGKLGVIGLRGGYHGDTIGAMDCAEPGVFNEKVEWYEGRGMWLGSPTVLCQQGEWVISVPEGMGEPMTFKRMGDIFDIDAREARGDHKAYEEFIEKTLKQHLSNGGRYGAVLIEPVVLGAGGMALVDPLYQRALVNVVRRSSHLFGTPTSTPASSTSSDPNEWTGLPIIFDEVFTGLYRLGRFTSASFLNTHPDISVHAKLLTGGLVPLCATLASESVFKAFESEDKTDALLHGHSYTAHPVGCQVAVESLKQMGKMDSEGQWDWAKNGWQVEERKNKDISGGVWSIWHQDFIVWLSQHSAVSGAWALGSVLAIHMQAPEGAGYTSTAAVKLRDALKSNASPEGGKPWNVHSRVLGNVIYIMGSQGTTETAVEELEDLIQGAIQNL